MNQIPLDILIRKIIIFELLFDLISDPGEKRNLIGDPRVAAEEMTLRDAVRRRAREIDVMDARAKLDATVRSLAVSMGIR